MKDLLPPIATLLVLGFMFAYVFTIEPEKPKPDTTDWDAQPCLDWLAGCAVHNDGLVCKARAKEVRVCRGRAD